MTAALQVSVYDKHVLVFSEEFDGPVELGRQSEDREGLYSPEARLRTLAAGDRQLDEEGRCRGGTPLLEPVSEEQDPADQHQLR